MAITIDKSFEVEQSREEVWSFLVDPERVVECLPGAKLLETVDERTYRGEMGVQMGPIGVTFRGTIRFEELDHENFRVGMSGEAKDVRGASGVKMRMESRLYEGEDGGTRVEVSQSVALSGKLASFGRAGIIESAADFMFGRFTKCVAKRLAEGR